MTSDLRPLIISLKPCYADLLFEGLKRVELRRRIASQLSDRDVFIYVSSPVRELRGGFRVGQVWEGRPDDVWNIVAELATVDRKEFDAYFNGQTVAYALEVTNVWEYEDPKGLDWLRSRFGEFVVPQSWRYAKPEEHETFRIMKTEEGEDHCCGQGGSVGISTTPGTVTVEKLTGESNDSWQQFVVPRSL